MKLLICTQKVDINDDVLGFFHDWICEFAKNCEKVTVICLFKGDYDLPDNVEVLSLGKENYKSKIRYIVNFYKYIFQKRNDYDAVFVHMNQVYVLLGGVFWRMWGKGIGLWYAHKSITWDLRLAEKLVNVIFTASKKSFRLESKKLNVLGHGIDISKFKIQNSKFKIDNKSFNIIAIGRISRVKNFHSLINAVEVLLKKNKSLKLKVNIVGGPLIGDDFVYFEELKNMVSEKNLVDIFNFVGSIPNKDVVKCYEQADLFVHTSNTGSLDKVMLEAMASGVLVLSCNDSGKVILGELDERFVFDYTDSSEVLAGKIEGVIELKDDEKGDFSGKLMRIVRSEHSLNELIKRIIEKINGKAS